MKISEYETKTSAINLCNHLLGWNLEDEDINEYKRLDEDGNVIPDDV